MSVRNEQRIAAQLLELTPSKLRQYLLCPQQYKLGAIDRKTRPLHTSSALSFGISMHAALEEIFRPSQPQGTQVNFEQILLRHWKANDYADEQDGKRHFEEGIDILRKYTYATVQDMGTVVGTEIFLSRLLNLNGTRVKFGCKADRIDLLSDGTLEVVDYKTSAREEIPSQTVLITDLPTFVYYLLARVTYPDHPCAGVSYVNLRTLVKTTVRYDKPVLLSNKLSLINVVHQIEAGSFEPRPNGTCSWCQVRDWCPAFGGEVDLDSIA